MLKIYGSMLCKDCVQCRSDLDKAGVAYEYLDFADSLPALKEFLAIRDSSPLFDDVKRKGGIGIPCIIDDDGKITLNWTDYVGQAEA